MIGESTLSSASICLAEVQSFGIRLLAYVADFTGAGASLRREQEWQVVTRPKTSSDGESPCTSIYYRLTCGLTAIPRGTKKMRKTVRLAQPDTPNPEEIRDIAAVFRTLGDRTRLHIVYACLQGPLTVSAIAERVGVSPALVSHHLRPLRDLRLVLDERRGREIFYTCNDEHVRNVLHDFLTHIRH